MGLKSFTNLALGTLASKLTSCVLHSASCWNSSCSLSCALVVARASSWHLRLREAGQTSAAASGVAVPGLAKNQHTPSVRLPVVAQDAFKQVQAREVGQVSAATPTVVAAPGLARHQHTTSGITASMNDIAIPCSTCTVLLLLRLEIPSRMSMCLSYGELHESRIGLGRGVGSLFIMFAV